MLEKIEKWISDHSVISLVLLVLAIFSVWLVWWIASSSMEARAFNRITESDVTTWEAMWVQLRVDRPVGN